MQVDDVIKVESRYIWLDEDDNQCSPDHTTLAAAMNFGVNWTRPDKYAWTKNRSTKPPQALYKVRIEWVVTEDKMTQSINLAFEGDRKND